MRFVLLGGLLALIVWLLLVRPTPADLRRYMKRGLLVGAAALLIFAVVTGRLHWLFALLGGLLPFANRLLGLLRFLPLFNSLLTQYRQGRGAAGPRRGNQSSVNTAHLRMHLDHDSGDMDGEILQGRLAGKRLSDLGVAELRTLFDEFSTIDEESAALLAAYLDRVHGENWREGRASDRATGGDERQSTAMSRQEALDILGLPESAEPDEVKAAHRRLMQKMHPDRGGSSYLAAKINRAKDVLLESG
ncbi:MAG: DnaJ domain-containing protein [Gammaproteobacteria bacterium]|nr:DnaJ domain-containing protein [Gammaproteobacteria bacterium]